MPAADAVEVVVDQKALLVGGCSIVAVASALGHDNPNVTLKVYGHLMASDEDRIRQALQDDVASLAATPLGPRVISVSWKAGWRRSGLASDPKNSRLSR